MRALTTFLATLALTLAACGGSDSKPADDAGTSTTSTNTTTTTTTTSTTATGRSPATQGKCPTAATSATCAELTTYQACQATKCLAEIKKAMGDGFMAGNYEGGSCGPMMTCMMACPCDATGTSCETGCYALGMQGTCMTDIAAMTTCVSTNCGAQPTCTGTTPSTSTLTATATSATTGTSCAAVGACCTALTATAGGAQYQAQCATITSAGEAACAQILAGWKTGGLCK